ncbi:MAG: hypothetical protein IKO30_08475 [Lachnospiraceae bacterium]|nr:hypothetical protein [Lachnospiraceae bacterium]
MIGIRDKKHIKILYRIIIYICAYLCVNIERPDLLSELNSAQSMLATEEPNLSAKYYSVSVTARAFSQAEHFGCRHERTSVKTV